MIADFKKSRLSLVLQLRVVQGAVCVPLYVGRWYWATAKLHSWGLQAVAPCPLPSLVAVSSGHRRVPILVPSCAGRLWSQREMWSSHSVFLILQWQCGLEHPCLSARSQKCCVCSLLNSCGFGRNVAGWGGCSWGALRQPPGYGWGQAAGSSGDEHSSAAIHGGSPISLCGRPGLLPDFISR